MFGFIQQTPGLPRLQSTPFISRASSQVRTDAKESSYKKRGGRTLSPLLPGTSAVHQDRQGAWTQRVKVDATRPSGRSYDLLHEDGSAATSRNTTIQDFKTSRCLSHPTKSRSISTVNR